jgi:hypothetical protein
MWGPLSRVTRVVNRRGQDYCELHVGGIFIAMEWWDGTMSIFGQMYTIR